MIKSSYLQYSPVTGETRVHLSDGVERPWSLYFCNKTTYKTTEKLTKKTTHSSYRSLSVSQGNLVKGFLPTVIGETDSGVKCHGVGLTERCPDCDS